MKTIKLSMKQLVVAGFLSLIILGGNVNAKGTETGFVSSLENTVEPELKVEDWMISDNYWNVTKESFDTVEAENSLTLESWMTDDDFWKPAAVKNLEGDKDEELKIENWMINNELWNTHQ